MSQETWIALFVAVGGVGGLWAAIRWTVVRLARTLDEHASKVEELSAQVLNGTDRELTPQAVIDRMDRLELQMTEWKEHMDRKTRALGAERRRLEKKYGELEGEEEDEEAQAQAPMLPLDNPPQEADSVREWARRQVAARGEQPIG